MARSAAFFDLDRTLLPGSSGPVFAAALGRLGRPVPHIPGQDLLFRLFDLMGESWLVMQLARQAVGRARGLDRADVADAAETAADELLGRLQPWAPQLLEQHRADGDLLVLATTSPYDLVAPFARRLGMDAVVATRYAEAEGRYTGELDGGFVWGPGKLEAVRAWAEANDVDLAESAAYSDSVFDAPLLGAVGRPCAVNPDNRLRVLALTRRWPVRSLSAPPGVPTVSGVELYDLARLLLQPDLARFARFRIEGVEHVPRRGPVLIAANHRSYLDPVAIGIAVAQAGRNGRFLGKREVFDAPLVGSLARAMGAIPVDRGTGSDAPLRAAAAALEAGEAVVILPEGTIPRGEAFFDPELEGRPGVARLAAMVDAPVVPLGVWGTERVWPRSSRLPDLRAIADPPEITLRFGPPIALRRSGRQADVRADLATIMAAIVDVLPPEARERRIPTPEELARSFPSGKVPAATPEGARADGPAPAAKAPAAKAPAEKEKAPAEKAMAPAKKAKAPAKKAKAPAKKVTGASASRRVPAPRGDGAALPPTRRLDGDLRAR